MNEGYIKVFAEGRKGRIVPIGNGVQGISGNLFNKRLSSA